MWIVPKSGHMAGQGVLEVDICRAHFGIVERGSQVGGGAVKLNLLVLRTPRLEDLKSFYSALGARFESERHGNGPDHYAAMLGDLVLELYPALDGTAPDSGLRLGVNVDDIGETLRLLGQTATPRQTQWGLRALVRDPDGRTVELLQSGGRADQVQALGPES